MADSFGVIFEGFDAVERELVRMVERADIASKEAVTKGGHLIESKAKQNFSGSHKRGQPHVGGSLPNVVTGNLRRSIHVASVRKVSAGVWESQTGPSAIYARRIELGFSLADSLGRAFHQNPFPFFAPGFESAKAELPHIFEEAWGTALAH